MEDNVTDRSRYEPTPQYADYVLVGGGLTSATAAKTIRQQDPDGRIVVISAEPHVPYHRPPLSKEYLKGDLDFAEAQIASREDYQSQKIEVRTGVRASKLDTAAKTVRLDNGELIKFGRLCVATGASANPLDPQKTPGADARNVLTLRTVEDSDRMRSYLKANCSVVILGAGYVGMEVAAICRQKGLNVTIVDTHDRPWSKNTSVAFGTFLRRYYEMQGVRLLLNDSIREIDKDASGDAISVSVTSGAAMPCNFVVAGVGACLNLELLQ
jgi:3-phenylpropionate/trans-cinnamate dioxygenase ferredoxin reductase subunit